MKYQLLTILFLFSINAHAQKIDEHQLDRMQARYQSCLDSGKHMLDCTTNFYARMDSVLNVVYTHLRATLTEPDRQQLKSSQLAWLKKRDLYLKQVGREAKQQGFDGEMYGMEVWDKGAQYVKDRVIVLLKYKP